MLLPVTETKPAEVEAASIGWLACHVIASLVLLYWLPARGTQLCVQLNPPQVLALR